jgi:hypothetical protein
MAKHKYQTGGQTRSQTKRKDGQMGLDKAAKWSYQTMGPDLESNGVAQESNNVRREAKLSQIRG